MPDERSADGRTAAAAVSVVLLAVYGATLAPGVTFWDAGEFLAAIHSLGIPHPPGTPLFILVGSVWGRIFEPVFGFARAVNLLSAAATAAACAVLAFMVARWTQQRVVGIAAGIFAGTLLSVWRNATETEVYALSLVLAVAALAVADRAGITGQRGLRVLAVYLLALGVPLHLSALVIAPGVVLAAASNDRGRIDWALAAGLSGAAGLAMALGVLDPWLAGAALLLLGGGYAARRGERVALRLGEAAALLGVLLLAAAALAVMYLRAQHDPFVNQGDPSTWRSLLAVVGREQYDVPGLWPRRAPLWLQLGNVVQYADWQVAFGLDRWVGASWWRTPWTLGALLLAFAGAGWHRRRDRRSFRVLALALTGASLGTVLVLNLRTGPSFGVGLLPEGTPHEARERDYFFALAFALAAVWVAMGAARLGGWVARVSRRQSFAPAVTLAIAALPVALNWRAADRSTADRATLAADYARLLLDSAPRDAVLFVGGDNDTYPLWFLQEVAGHRRDVAIVTVPLLPADWYRRELQRRAALAEQVTGAWLGTGETMRRIARRAQASGRPVAVALSLAPAQRVALGTGRWTVRGTVLLPTPPAHGIPLELTEDSLRRSSAAEADLWADTTLHVSLPALPPLERLEGTERHIAGLIDCAGRVRMAVARGAAAVATRCNLR